MTTSKKSKPKKSTTDSKKESIEAKIFVSKSIDVNAKKHENQFKRADLEFYGIDLSGPSYEARVFLNNPKANSKTAMTSKNGFVGSFFIFGHGGCYGDWGHCEVPTKKRFYDYRPAHQLSPMYKFVEIPKSLHKVLLQNKKITITVVPIVRTLPVVESRHGLLDTKNVLKFTDAKLKTYY